MSLPSLVTVPWDEGFPCDPDVVVRAEDRWLVLGRASSVEPTTEDTGALLREAARFEPRAPGSIEVRGGDPVEVLAVVHDLEREPTCRPAWVEEALERIMDELHAQGAACVGLPVLGARHGTLRPLRFHRALRDALEAVTPWALRTICLRVPPRVDPEAIRDMRRSWGDG